MKRLITAICILINLFSFGQVDSARNVIYLEGMGPGSIYSINYERNVLGFFEHYNLFGRVGFETHHLTDYRNKFNPQFNIPFGLHVTYGHRFRTEIGLGMILSSEQFAGYANRRNGLSGYYSVGFRYQKPEGGLFGRVAYTPLILYFRNYKHWLGLSIGYSF
jgi:hypothetical protein